MNGLHRERTTPGKEASGGCDRPFRGNPYPPMNIERSHSASQGMPICFIASAMLLTLAGCSPSHQLREPDTDHPVPRAELSIGYSLLYQEAKGIPTLHWLLMFKSESAEMCRASYMDAPSCQAFFSIPVLQVEIAAIHSASVCGLSPRALMEFAG